MFLCIFCGIWVLLSTWRLESSCCDLSGVSMLPPQTLIDINCRPTFANEGFSAFTPGATDAMMPSKARSECNELKVSSKE